MNTRTTRGDRTRTEILDAARTLLVQDGLDGFSLRETARMSGLAPSAIYNHFESKDALVNELAMEAVGVLGEYLGKVPRDLPAPQRLMQLAWAYLAYADDHPVRYRLIFGLLVSPTSAWDEYAQVAFPFTLIIDAVDSGLASGELADVDGVGAAGIAYGFWSLVHGAVALSAHHLASIRKDELTPLKSAAFACYVRGIANAERNTKKGTTAQ